MLDREAGPDTETFRSAGLGDELIFRFPVMNLAQWRRHRAKLEALAPTNPFAVVVMAQLVSRATRPDGTRLWQRPVHHTRRLGRSVFGDFGGAG